jgi:hypothetical protein
MTGRRSNLSRWRDVVVDDVRLSVNANLVAYVLMRFMDTDTVQCWCSFETIAERAGVSKSSVRRGVRELCRMGYLRISETRYRGRATFYTGVLTAAKGSTHDTLSSGGKGSTHDTLSGGKGSTERHKGCSEWYPNVSNVATPPAGAPSAGATDARPAASLEDLPKMTDDFGDWWSDDRVEAWFGRAGHEVVELITSCALDDCADEWSDPDAGKATWTSPEARAAALDAARYAVQYVAWGGPPLDDSDTMVSYRVLWDELVEWVDRRRQERKRTSERLLVRGAA